jgi:co-chaperonin GroES (HSP10)
MPEIHTDVTSNILKLGTLELEAHADRIVVIQDPFVSGYECTHCGGKQKIACDNCESGVTSTNKKCSQCAGSGKIVCPKCEGKGGLLVVPEASERRPTTGTIVSTGFSVEHFKRGESVIYPSFSGHAFDIQAEDIRGQEVIVTICILRESEVLARVRGHLELRRVKRSAAVGTAA